MTIGRTNNKRLGKLIEASRGDCPSCGWLLSPIVPLLNRKGNVVGVDRTCSNDDCIFGTSEKSNGMLTRLWKKT